MRVLVITNMYPRDDDPSYGVFVADQLRALRNLGVDAELYFIEGYLSRSRYLRAIAELRRRRGQYQVYHAHHTYAAAAAAAAGVRPLVITVHEGAVTTRPAYRRLARAVARRTQARVAVSDPIAQALAPLDARVIPIGIDLAVFFPRDRLECRRALGLDPSKYYVLFATNPARPEKRYDLAVAGAALAARDLPRLELLVMPPVPRAVVPLYFGAADVSLVTSDYESGPLTVKEAVACGLPVVSRRVGDVAFLEKCPACLITGDTPAEVAQGILRSRDVSAVDGEVVKRYEINAVTTTLINLYREVASSPDG